MKGLSQLMRQAQEMQANMQRAQEQLAAIEERDGCCRARCEGYTVHAQVSLHHREARAMIAA